MGGRGDRWREGEEVDINLQEEEENPSPKISPTLKADTALPPLGDMEYPLPPLLLLLLQQQGGNPTNAKHRQ